MNRIKETNPYGKYEEKIISKGNAGVWIAVNDSRGQVNIWATTATQKFWRSFSERDTVISIAIHAPGRTPPA